MPSISAAPNDPAPDTRPILFVECTNTYHSPVQTGIQRVVRNILRNAGAVAADHGYRLVPVVFHGHQFREADLAQVLAEKSFVPGMEAPAAARPRRTARGLIVGTVRPVYRRTRRALARLLPFPAAQRFLFAHPVEFGLAWCVLLPWRLLRRAVFAVIPSLAVPKAADPAALHDGFGISLESIADHAGHVLLLLDASWGIPLWPAVERFQAAGGRTLGVIYDLVPLTHVETSVRSLHKEYVEWVSEHRRVSGRFLTISRTVAGELGAYLQTHEPTAPWTVTPFYLGSELDFIDPAAVIRPAVAALFGAETPVFIVVGSIEPRKNHRYILDAFDLLWDRGGTARLVIIGRFGWKNEDVVARILAHPHYGTRLHLVRDMADSELDFAYRQASALVIASETEGFGLPVVEAFQRGLPVLCSDIPVFREIADGRAHFFGLGDPARLADVAGDFAAAETAQSRALRQKQPWLTWRESTEQLLDLALAPAVRN